MSDYQQQQNQTRAPLCPLYQLPMIPQIGGMQPPLMSGTMAAMTSPNYHYNPFVPPMGDPLGLAPGPLGGTSLLPSVLPSVLPSMQQGLPGGPGAGMMSGCQLPNAPGMMPLADSLSLSNNLWGGANTMFSAANSGPQALHMQQPLANGFNTFTNGIGFVNSGVGTLNGGYNLYNAVQNQNWTGAANAGANMTTSFVNGALAYQTLNGVQPPGAWSYINVLPAGTQLAGDLISGQPRPIVQSSVGNFTESLLHGAAGANAFGPYGQAISQGVQLGEWGYTAIPGLATPNSPTTLGQMYGQGTAVMEHYGPYMGAGQILNGMANDPRADDPNGNFISQGVGQQAQTIGQLGLLFDWGLNSLFGHPEQSMMGQINNSGG